MTTPVDITVNEAQKAIEAFSNNLKCTRWEAKLPFIGSSLVKDFDLCLDYVEHSNLLDFCKSEFKGFKVYFSPNMYPSPYASVDTMGIDKLRVDLARVAHSHGYNILSNGSNASRTKDNIKVFLCQSSRTYKSSLDDEQAPYRSTSLHNDRKNSRGADGRSLTRRTKSIRPLLPKDKCSFRFTVKWDLFGIYFCCGLGSAEHNHCQLLPAEMCFSARLLEGVQRDTLKDLGGSYANCGVGRNYVFRKEGVFFSRSQVRYLYKDSEFIYNKNATNDCHEMPPGSLLKYFDDTTDVSYCVLGNIVHQCSGVVLVNEFRGDDSNPITTILNEQEYGNLFDTTTGHREAYRLSDNENLFVAVAWVYIGELRLLRQFPFVIKVDDTSHTNNEKRPHLTFTAQTSSGKIFTWLRVFLPNKSAGCFRWIFCCVLPRLIGNEILQNIRLCITDGDSQETSQLDAAIRLHFPRITRVRCGWHLVEKGWQLHCPGERSVSFAKKAEFKAFIQVVKCWLYSWMRPGFCETEDEYHISKVLFFNFIKSPWVLSICDNKSYIPEQILSFVIRHIFPHENYYAFHLRKYIFHFDEYNNCSHEGSNNAIKSGAAAVLPGHDIASSGKRLHFQGKMKCAEIVQSAAKEFVSRELWSNEIPTIGGICGRGQALIVHEWSMRLKYAVQREIDHTWEVIIMTSHREIMGSDDCNKEWDKLPIPIFQRKRNVTRDIGGRMHCNCGYPNRIGLSCRHIFAVICFECPDYAGPTTMDVSVNWWKSYCHLAFRKDTLDTTVQKQLDTLFLYLSTIDAPGPLMPTSYGINSHAKATCMGVKNLFNKKTLLQSIINYDEHVMKRILGSYDVTESTIREGNLFGDSSLFNGYKNHCHIAENHDIAVSSNDSIPEFLSCFENSQDGSFTMVSGNHGNTKWQQECREKLQSSLSELMTVVDCCDNEAEGKHSVDMLWKHINEVTVRLRSLSFAEKRTSNPSTECDNKENHWISLTQEREKKRSRQFVSGNGLRR